MAAAGGPAVITGADDDDVKNTFIADHPFMYAIVNTAGDVLFSGQISQ